MPSRVARPTIATLAAASTLLLSGLLLAPQAGAATLYACVKKNNGSARFVSARTSCRRSERKISWNTQGVPGRNGTSGKNGAAGKTGPAGKNGTNGKDGVNGANGKDGVNGANGKDGASAGLVSFSDSPFELPLTRHAVATLSNVPPGNYIVTAKALLHAGPTEGVTVHCYMAGDEAATEISVEGYGSVALLGVLVSPLTASISLECNDFGTGGIEVTFARIVAIQLQSLGGTTS